MTRRSAAGYRLSAMIRRSAAGYRLSAIGFRLRAAHGVCLLLYVFVVALALIGLTPEVRGGQTVVRFHVRPMAAPKPALKYQLLPELRELNPGNPAHNYLRCFAEQRQFFFSREATAERARYLSLPLADLAAQKIHPYGGSALRQADWAARLDAPDWQLIQRVQTEGLDMQASELGRLQILAAALQVRFRIEVAGGHFDDAVRSAKTMLALARHLGDYPTEPANRLGMIVAESACGTLEEMVQQPKCPNLYWALTDLPCPLVDLRKGIQGDCVLVATELRQIRGDTPMTDEQLRTILANVSGKLGFAREQTGQPPRNVRGALSQCAANPETVNAARDRLVEAGCPKDVAQKFPPLQIVLLDEKRKYEVQRDEAIKLLGLRPWEIDHLHGTDVMGNCAQGLFADLLPQVSESRRAQARLEQRIGLLRHVEALRLYAADHAGKLPHDLSELPVPVPSNPLTGKPFIYKLDGTIAFLREGPSGRKEGNGCTDLQYEVVIQP
jgi:hypothetical protein